MAAYKHCYDHLPVLYEEIEAGLIYENYRNAKSMVARARNGLTWAKQKRFLSDLLSNGQVCTVVSENEKQLISSITGENQSITVIPNCVDLLKYEGISEEVVDHSLIYTGSFRYYPNYEAMVWFVDEVFPKILAQVPDACLTITGDDAGLRLPDHKQVHHAGYVDDIRRTVARSQVSLVPLRSGGGTRLKILEAMALGTPVVSTSKGAEGLDVENNVHLLIADQPDDFARQVVALLNDPQLRARLAANGRSLIRAKYDWAVVMPVFLDLVESVACSTAHAQKQPSYQMIANDKLQSAILMIWDRFRRGDAKKVIIPLVIFLSAALAIIASTQLNLYLLALMIGGLGILLLTTYPSLGFLLIIVAAVSIPFEGAGGFNLAVIGVIGLAALWILDMIVRQRRLSMAPSKTNLPIIVFLVSATLSFFLGQVPWYSSMPQAPMTAQIGGYAIFFLSAVAFLLVGNLVSELIWLKLITWLFLLYGALYTLRQVGPFCISLLTEYIPARRHDGQYFLGLVVGDPL